jgi:hypothetical protein
VRLLRLIAPPNAHSLLKSHASSVQETGAAKVALLFLTAGDVFHTETWMHWLRSAAGILPVETATESVCELQGLALDAAATACQAPSDDVIGQQHLFSIYVHLSAEIHGMSAHHAMGCCIGLFVASKSSNVFGHSCVFRVGVQKQNLTSCGARI